MRTQNLTPNQATLIKRGRDLVSEAQDSISPMTEEYKQMNEAMEILEKLLGY